MASDEGVDGEMMDAEECSSVEANDKQMAGAAQVSKQREVSRSLLAGAAQMSKQRGPQDVAMRNWGAKCHK